MPTLHYLTDHYIDQSGAHSESAGFGLGGKKFQGSADPNPAKMPNSWPNLNPNPGFGASLLMTGSSSDRWFLTAMGRSAL